MFSMAKHWPFGFGPRGLLGAALWLMVVAPAWPQVPDNRGLRLDPEDPVPPAYGDTLSERDSQRLEDARQEGESFLPLFQGTGSSPPAVEEGVGAGPAAPPPVAASELVRRPSVPAVAPPSYEGYGASVADQREGGFSHFIDVLLESWNRPPVMVRLRYPVVESGRREDARAQNSSAGAPVPTVAPADDARVLPPIMAGDGIYARTLYAVNSDFPGPVLLELLEPPLVGAVASGQFTLVRDRMVLRLSSLQYRGRNVPVDAWAVGLDCACYGVGGVVDRHFLERVVLPAAVRFAEGFLTALGRPAETVHLQSGGVVYERSDGSLVEDVFSGLGAAAAAAGDVLLEDAPRRPTVRIPRDSELVVVFAAAPPESARAAGRAREAVTDGAGPVSASVGGQP